MSQDPITSPSSGGRALIVAIGEVGIANTTVAAALAAGGAMARAQ